MPCDVKTGMQVLKKLIGLMFTVYFGLHFPLKKILISGGNNLGYNVKIHAWDKELSHMHDSIKQMTVLWEPMTESWIKSEVVTMEARGSELRGKI